RAVAGPGGAVGPQPGLVQPVDLGPDPLRLGGDGRVHPGPPPGEVGRALLVRPAGRPPRGGPVPPEPPAPRPPGPAGPEPPGGVPGPGLPGPRGVRDAQVVRVAGAGGSGQGRLLARAGRAAGRWSAPAAGAAVA